MKNGIRYKDMKKGSGVRVKFGQKLHVYHVGQTEDGRTFDKCLQGPRFEFTYGAGEVMKGWDVGFDGMRVGGKRKLIIPPHLAYGALGSPPVIPPDATLKYTVLVKDAVWSLVSD